MKSELEPNSLYPTEIARVSLALEAALTEIVAAYRRQPHVTRSDATLSAYGFLLETLNRVGFSKMYDCHGGVAHRSEHCVYNMVGIMGDQAGMMAAPFSKHQQTLIIQALMVGYNGGIADPSPLVAPSQIPPHKLS